MAFEFEFKECECQVFGVTCVAKIVDGRRKLFRKSDNRLIIDIDSDISGFEKNNPMIDNIIIDDKLYDEWVYEIMRLKPSKQKNWKSTLIDKQGQKTKCKYENDTFYNYSMVTHKWVQVYRRSYLDTMDYSQSMCDMSNNMVGLMTLLSEKSLNEIIEPEIDANHTGNHTGRVNHTIKIPRTASSAGRC